MTESEGPVQVLRLRSASGSRWVEWAGRVGLAAQGVSYALVAGLALLLVAGGGGKTADRPGAFRTLADDTLGVALLVALAAGFAGYAAWRFAVAFLDRGGNGHDAKGLGKRAGSLGKGLIYAGLAVGIVNLLSGGSGQAADEDETTAGVLGWPGGRWIVFGVALAIAAAAAWNVYRGVSAKFEKDLRLEQMSPGARRWVRRLGAAGLTARGVVFGIAAWFLGRAAYEFDPSEAVGIGGALAKLASAAHGPYLLGAVALGLLAFAVFCLAQARYRAV
jgi:hypothetical protein